MEKAALGINRGFLLKGNPNVRRVAFQSFTEKSGWSDTDDSQRMAFNDESGACDGGIRGISGLPNAVAEDGDGERGGLVVIRRK